MAKKAGRFDYLIAGILALLGIFFFAMNAITVGIVFLAALGFWVYASPRIYPKYSLGLTGMGKAVFAVLVLLGFVIGAVNDSDRISPPETQETNNPKAAYVSKINKASEYVSEVDVSESQTEISISITHAWDEASYFDKAGKAVYDITRAIHEDVPTYAENQLLFVLYAPFESGQERAATITFRPNAITVNTSLFEKEIPYQSFLNISDRVIAHQGRAGKLYLTDWCDDPERMRSASLFCQKAREQ